MIMSGKYFLMLMIFGSLSMLAYGQQTIDLAESVVKIGIKGEESVYFGFAEGDQLIFSFEEANGKDMKEVEIIEMPANSRFMDVKTSKIENKTLQVPRTAIYKFRFANSALLPRSCRYKIQRIPASDATQKFNSTVYYDTYNDTSYTNEVETYIDRTDTIINNFQDRTIKVNPLTAPGSSKTTFNFTLPENTVAWSYYIMADKAGLPVYQEANRSLASNAVWAVQKFPKYSPLAAVATDASSYLIRLDTGQRINYWIVENENADLFQNGQQFRFIKKGGRVVNDFAKMEPGDRAFYFCFHNDSKEVPVTVTVKITAIMINEKLVSQPVKKMHITPRNGMHLRN